MPEIHPTAIVSKDFDIASDVVIGPNCLLIGKGSIGAGSRLIANVTIQGPITIGQRAQIYPGACLGFEGQDIKFKPGMPTAGVVIGDDCLLRESVTIHAATKPDAPTRVGNRAFMMVCSHIGHDARIDDDVVMVNNTCLGGHAHVAAKATIGGGAMVHQFGRVGRLALLSGGAAMSLDVPPFCVAYARNILGGLNLVGMRRNGLTSEAITNVREAFRVALKPNYGRQQTLEHLAPLAANCPEVAELYEFYATAKRASVKFVTSIRENAIGGVDA